MKTQVNNLIISSFPKILSLKSFGNFVWQFVRQFVRSVFGDNFLFYFFIISWLRLQQEIKWVNINFDKRDLTSAQKSHSSPDDFGKTFLFTLIKQNVTYFSFIFLTQNFLLCLWNLKFKLLLPGTVSFSTSCVCVYVCVCVCLCVCLFLFTVKAFPVLQCQSSGQRWYAEKIFLSEVPLSSLQRRSQKEPSSWQLCKRVSITPGKAIRSKRQLLLTS